MCMCAFYIYLVTVIAFRKISRCIKRSFFNLSFSWMNLFLVAAVSFHGYCYRYHLPSSSSIVYKSVVFWILHILINVATNHWKIASRKDVTQFDNMDRYYMQCKRTPSFIHNTNIMTIECVHSIWALFYLTKFVYVI